MTILEEVQENHRKREAGEKVDQKKEEREDTGVSLGRRLAGAFVLFMFCFIGVAWVAEAYVGWRASHQWQVPVVWIGLVKEIEGDEEFISPISKPVEAAEVETVEEEKISWTGKVSFYSSGDGCIGCHPEEIMANGEKFDENAMTLAFNKLPLNTKVRVTNLDNGANIIATVTDTGGFEQYGRIADLSEALMMELNAKTDISNIKIESL